MASIADVDYRGQSVSDPETRSKLEKLAAALGATVHVTSGDRTTADQERLLRQGYHPARQSQHLFGHAADIYVDGRDTAEVAEAARKVGFTGIGTYRDGHVHVDTRESSGVVTWSR